MTTTMLRRFVGCLGAAALVVLAGCSGDDGPTGPGGETRPTGVDFEMAAAGVDYTVYLGTQSLGRLDSIGETVSRDLGAGTYSFHVVDNIYNRQSEDRSFQIGANQRVKFQFGTGSETIQWLQGASYDNLTATIDQAHQLVYIGTRLSVSDRYIGRSLTHGKYWLKKVGTAYNFFTAPGRSFNTPGNYVGYTLQVRPQAGWTNQFIEASYGFPYASFPDRSAGATYYAFARLYDSSSISSVHSHSIAQIGPPETIARLTWSKAGKNGLDTEPVIEIVPCSEAMAAEIAISCAIEDIR
ncbi:MAG: hypothetical protein IPK64_00235 [bacterium]|nr:hypothetical protein [bacterium]